MFFQVPLTLVPSSSADVVIVSESLATREVRGLAQQVLERERLRGTSSV